MIRYIMYLYLTEELTQRYLILRINANTVYAAT